MADTMTGLTRTMYCGALTAAQEGKMVTVCGWVDRIRNKGALIFVDLRDRSGIVQLTFDDQTQQSIRQKAAMLHSEYVVAARGSVVVRESKNPELATGEIELFVTDLRILSQAKHPPFHIHGDGKVGEEVALRYRYLDLRRKALQHNLKVRHELTRATRTYFCEHDFYEIETPMLIRSTPEGARDYLVPSRVHRGDFYALPQSPQIYKQLLMVAGYDRYFQLARCFRDEDLRADRQPEFTQIDFEMSFVDIDDILAFTEGYIAHVFSEVLGQTVSLPIPRLTYAQSMVRYGTDKPDTRFGMELVDISELVKDCSFSVFSDAVQNGGSVRAIVAKQVADTLTRKAIDKLGQFVRGIGAKGLAFVRFAQEIPSCSFGKFVSDSELTSILQAVGCEQGDVAFFIADKDAVTLPVLGALRVQVAKQLDIIPDTFRFVWITEFPFFEFNQQHQTWDAMHHPFTMPMDACLPYLETDPGRVCAKAYDLVVNGVELSSGSIRITDSALQQKMFEALGMTKQEIDAKFGFLVEAYQYGAPPHGGMGMGLDRLAMMMAGGSSLRDVIAFPKLQNASEPMSRCPAPVDNIQLQELGLGLLDRDSALEDSPEG